MSTVSPTSSSAANAASNTPNSAAMLTQNYNDFLTLLTTQMKNQDPMSPMDTNQFTQQLVEFSQVEQQINTNTNLQQLITLQGTDETISALPLVGKTIEYNEATAPLADSNATFVYTLPSNTSSTALSITDANGHTVYTATGQTQSGTYVLNWNGQTNAGVQLPDGNYSLKIQATDANGAAVTPTFASVGTVAGVGVQNGQASFTVNGMTIPLTELVTVNPNFSSSN
jgi:flagellar basal-body rod modification protein FlgD